IVPTIADMLEVRLPWRVDGRSTVTSVAAERIHKAVLRGAVFDPKRVEEALARKLRLFGHGSGTDRLWLIGPHPELIGRPAADIGFTTGATVRFEILSPEHFEAVQPDGPVIPALVSGRALFGSSATAVDVAVAINGVVQAVAQVVPERGGEGRMSVLVPER